MEAEKQKINRGCEGWSFTFSPVELPALSGAAPHLRRRDEMESRWRSRGNRSHYQRIGFGVKQWRWQITGTKPQGFSNSIEMQRAINFIICLQMRSTLLQSLEYVSVYLYACVGKRVFGYSTWMPTHPGSVVKSPILFCKWSHNPHAVTCSKIVGKTAYKLLIMTM